MNDDLPMYSLELRPLRYDDNLTSNVVNGVKRTLGSVFEDPFAVRDVVIAVREVVDNIVTHADWNHPRGPSLRIWFSAETGTPKFNIIAQNQTADPER